jgi:hypothetical protein
VCVPVRPRIRTVPSAHARVNAQIRCVRAAPRLGSESSGADATPPGGGMTDHAGAVLGVASSRIVARLDLLRAHGQMIEERVLRDADAALDMQMVVGEARWLADLHVALRGARELSRTAELLDRTSAHVAGVTVGCTTRTT